MRSNIYNLYEILTIYLVCQRSIRVKYAEGMYKVIKVNTPDFLLIKCIKHLFYFTHANFLRSSYNNVTNKQLIRVCTNFNHTYVLEKKIYMYLLTLSRKRLSPPSVVLKSANLSSSFRIGIKF